MKNQKTIASDQIAFSAIPQNEEWLALLPNQDKNVSIIINKLLEEAISNGDLLRIVSKMLSTKDLAVFKNNYTKMLTTRNQCLSAITDSPNSVNVPSVEIVEKVEAASVSVPQAPAKAVSFPSNGFDIEDSF